MESLQQTVFTAVKDGKLKLLKGLLANKSSSQLKELACSKIEGTTPLIVAAREGHLDIVQYLINKCHVDVYQCGSVVFDGETIEDAPPLWCAAAAGHFHVVKCLIHHKANPNCTTQTNSTPLRAACFDGHLGIVKYLLEHKADVEIANRHDHTCLMIACYKGHYEIVKTLLEAGADVNRCSIKRNTALHDCAEHGSVSIAKLLLKYDSKCKRDSHGMTPLMTAAVAGHVQLTEFFASLPRTTRLEIIEANELLGATYIDKKHDISRALTFWKKALELRASSPVLRHPTQAPVVAYGYVTEPKTVEDLQAIRTNPEKTRMVALLLRERILGPRHPDTTYFIRYRGAVYADSGDFEKCVALWMYALDMQRSNLDPLYPMTLSSLLSFAELFSFMQQNRSHMSSTVPKANHKQIMAVLERAVQEIRLGYEIMVKNFLDEKEKTCSVKKPRPRSSRTEVNRTHRSSPAHSRPSPPNSSNARSIGGDLSRRSTQSHNVPTCCTLCEASNQRIYRAMVITLHLTALSETAFKERGPSLPENELRAAVDERNRLLYQLRSVQDHCKQTLLHLASCNRACLLGRYPVTRFPNVGIVDVLLKCGFDPNARDYNGKTAGHLAAEMAKDYNSSSSIDLVKRLLESGSHIDSVDKSGSTILDYLGPALASKVSRLKHQSLQCLAAQVVVDAQIKYEKVIPKDLANFVKIHEVDDAL